MIALLKRYPVVCFIAATLLAQLGIVLVAWTLMPDGERMHSDSAGAKAAHMIFRLRVFFPLGLAMLITVFLDGWSGLKKLFGSFFHWHVDAKWYVLAFTWKFVLGYIGIFAVVALGLDVMPPLVNADAVPNLLHTAAFVVGIAVVEETSWIRFCVTRLQEKRSAFFSSAVVGIAWSLWYLMMMLLGEGVPDGIPWFAFIISMFSLSVLLTWAYNTTRSGTVLLIMQIFSNCAFLVAPMLPVPGKPPYFMIGFVLAFLALSFFIIAYNGTEHLSRARMRAKWSGDENEGSSVDPQGAPELAAAATRF